MTGYLCYSVSVWIFSRFLTWKFGFWEPSQQCLDLSCLPVLICLVSWSGFVLSPGLDLSCLLVSWNKQIFGHLAVSWTRKQATHPQVSWEKAWEQQQFLEIEKAVLRYWCQSPPCLSKSESAAAVLFILSIYLKILGQPFLGWKLQRTLNHIYLK